MANYGRDTGEEYSIAGDLFKVGAAVFTGIAALNTVQTGRKNSQKQDIQNQIANCDRRINELSSGFLGSWLNSEEIEAEKKKRAELQRRYNAI